MKEIMGFRGTWVQLHSGDKFDYQNPQVEQIHANDIAWALGRRCRYLGMTRDHYSVAEHCIILAQHAMDTMDDVNLALWALLHDAPETYIPDFPRPFRNIPVLKERIQSMEDLIMNLIAKRFELEGEMPEWVKVHDMLILHDEALQVFPDSPIDNWHECWGEGMNAKIKFMAPGHATVAYFKKLTDLLAIRLGQEPWSSI